MSRQQGRKEFSKAVRLAAFQRCQGCCEKCGVRLYPGKFEYHHINGCAYSGTADLFNCQVLCVNCHAEITREQKGRIAKSNRVRAKHLGLAPKRKSRPMPGSRASGIRKRMNGTVERW